MLVKAYVCDNFETLLNIKHVVSIGKGERTEGLFAYTLNTIYLVVLRCLDGCVYRMEFESEEERNEAFDKVKKYMEGNSNE